MEAFKITTTRKQTGQVQFLHRVHQPQYNRSTACHCRYAGSSPLITTTTIAATTSASEKIKVNNWLKIGGILVALLVQELLGIAGSVCFGLGRPCLSSGWDGDMVAHCELS